MTPNYLPRHERSGYLPFPVTPRIAYSNNDTSYQKYVAFLQSSSGLNEPETCADRFLDFFVLMLQK